MTASPAQGNNRGPAAAEGNRRAILGAARTVFARDGFRAPLNAVAREAGVGQGVLYRHFPHRIDLAIAVFETNLREFERLARDPSPGTLALMWNRLIDLVIKESAFIDMMVAASRERPEYDGDMRMRHLLQRPLAVARDAGRVHPELTVDDLILGSRMVYGIAQTAQNPTKVRAEVSRALRRAALLPATMQKEHP